MSKFISIQPGILQIGFDHFEYYAVALDTFLRELGATEENIGEFDLIYFPAANCQGVYRSDRLVGAAFAAQSDSKSFIICQDMREVTA